MRRRDGEVTIHEAAEILGMNPASLRRWCQEGRLTTARAELGLPRPDGSGRIVKRYWIGRAELEAMAQEGAGV